MWVKKRRKVGITIRQKVGKTIRRKVGKTNVGKNTPWQKLIQ